MLLDSLIPMQNSLREAEQIPSMVDFVRNGGIFTRETLSVFLQKKDKEVSPLFKVDNLIKVVKFEDGALYLHDGLHRTTSIWIAGRRVLDPREFVLENWKYEDYLAINLEQKWYTPFDPRKEVRTCDNLAYKGIIESFINREPKPTKEEIEFYIIDHHDVGYYTEPRSVNSIAEVARNFDNKVSRHTSAIPAEVE